MSQKTTIHICFDNHDGQLIAWESTMFFNCDYDPIYRNAKTAFLSEQRTATKRQEAIETHRTFLCGCCKRPLKIVTETKMGKSVFILCTFSI